MVTARELDRMMEAQFGPGWRDKALASPMGVYPLRDVFEECGLEDPCAPRSEALSPRGLFQTIPVRFTGSRPQTPLEQVRGIVARYGRLDGAGDLDFRSAPGTRDGTRGPDLG